MPIDLIVKSSAPTLAGIKTASLFPCPYEDESVVRKEIRELNKILNPKGLCLIPMKYSTRKVLLYLFRPGSLRIDLQSETALQILSDAGYTGSSSGKLLGELIRRLSLQKEFPHEIGLFLGYPPEDVKGFIDNKAANFKCNGCWKVYGNPAAAQVIFQSYKICTESLCSGFRSGISLERLAVKI